MWDARRWLISVATCLALMGILESESAARQITRPSSRSNYRSHLQRSTVSPYMNLFRRDTGPLPNYQSLVRPQLQQQEINQSQQAGLSRLGQELAEQQAASAVPLRATGHRSVFNEFSHFYPKKR